jgi:hypothetical protein
MKSKIIFIAICVVVVYVLSGAVWCVKSLFAQELTEIETINKHYAEETIKSEIEYAALWEYVENMSEQEYYDTFFKVQHDK